MKPTIDGQIKSFEEYKSDSERYKDYKVWIDYTLGKLYEKKGDKEKAKELYQSALEDAEKRQICIFTAAMCAKKLGLEEKAKYFYEKIPEENKKYYKI
jgi:tetratricopeptide (TPR) repeat protein